MNTAVRVLTKRVYFEKTQFWLPVCLGIVFFSALGVVYVKDLNRRLFIEYHQLQQEKQQQLRRLEQLLLDYSRWSTRPVLEQIGKTKLSMHMPTTHEIILIASSRDAVAWHQPGLTAESR